MERESTISQVCNDLIGTCSMQGIEAHLEDAGITMLTMPELQQIDSIVFDCKTCGWFCSADEINDYDDDWHCDSCAEGDDNASNC